MVSINMYGRALNEELFYFPFFFWLKELGYDSFPILTFNALIILKVILQILTNSYKSRYQCTAHFYTTESKIVSLASELKMNNGQKSMQKSKN